MHRPWKTDIQRLISASLPTGKTIRVLEAGGGRKVNIDLPSDHILTAIDIDPAALEMNAVAHEKIIGDIQTYDLGHRRFDLIVCWDVLEHLSDPRSAIARLASALSPGGLLLIKGPVVNSLKSLIARATPHSAHVAFYRYVYNSKNAGKPGFAPYRVELAADADDTVLQEMLRASGLGIMKAHRFEGGQAGSLRERAALLYAPYAFIGNVMSRATSGRWGCLETDFFIVARKPPTALPTEGEIPRRRKLKPSPPARKGSGEPPPDEARL
jgi:SAM-dependent methyltransferase